MSAPADSDGIRVRVDSHGVKVAEVDLNAVLDDAHGRGIAVSAAGAEKGDLILRGKLHLQGAQHVENRRYSV